MTLVWDMSGIQLPEPAPGRMHSRWYLNYIKGTLALAHNGNLINANELRRKNWQYGGAIFQTTIDSEVIAYHIARERVKSKTVEEAVGKQP